MGNARCRVRFISSTKVTNRKIISRSSRKRTAPVAAPRLEWSDDQWRQRCFDFGFYSQCYEPCPTGRQHTCPLPSCPNGDKCRGIKLDHPEVYKVVMAAKGANKGAKGGKKGGYSKGKGKGNKGYWF